jgi:hypothetical protein
MARLLAGVDDVGPARPIVHIKEDYQLQICHQCPEMLIFWGSAKNNANSCKSAVDISLYSIMFAMFVLLDHYVSFQKLNTTLNNPYTTTHLFLPKSLFSHLLK